MPFVSGVSNKFPLLTAPTAIFDPSSKIDEIVEKIMTNIWNANHKLFNARTLYTNSFNNTVGGSLWQRKDKNFEIRINKPFDIPGGPVGVNALRSAILDIAQNSEILRDIQKSGLEVKQALHLAKAKIKKILDDQYAKLENEDISAEFTKQKSEWSITKEEAEKILIGARNCEPEHDGDRSLSDCNSYYHDLLIDVRDYNEAQQELKQPAKASKPGRKDVIGSLANPYTPGVTGASLFNAPSENQIRDKVFENRKRIYDEERSAKLAAFRKAEQQLLSSLDNAEQKLQMHSFDRRTR